MTLVELFAGGGGAALGLHRAGFRSLAACEWDQHAAATLRAAVADGRLTGDVIEGDVRRDWSAYAGADAVWASPPCQAWSTAGKRKGVEDERNGWPWTFDAIDAMRPTWFMAENVPGMTHFTGDCRSRRSDCCPAHYLFRTVLPACEKRFASVQWTILNAADYGVPQNRHRLYIVCGPRPIEWPKPTHADPEILRQAGLFGGDRKPWLSCGEALGLTGIIGGGTRGNGLAEWKPRDLTNEPAATVNAMNTSSAGHYVVDSRHPACDPSSPAGTIRSGGKGHSTPPLYIRTEMNGAGAVSIDGPSPTLPLGGNVYLHDRDPGVRDGAPEAPGIRRVTVEEELIIMAWPSDWPLQGGVTAKYQIVGNGCCPPVVEAIGRAVLAADSIAAQAAK